jgi:hypothetical protein
VLETLGGVSHHDALSRERELSPLMKGLHEWMEAQLGQSDLLFTESLAETDAFSAAKRAHQSTTTTSSVP